MSSVPSSSSDVSDLFNLGFASPVGPDGLSRAPATPVLTGKLDTGGGCLAMTLSWGWILSPRLSLDSLLLEITRSVSASCVNRRVI
jgi:hypothetical protein